MPWDADVWHVSSQSSGNAACVAKRHGICNEKGLSIVLWSAWLLTGSASNQCLGMQIIFDLHASKTLTTLEFRTVRQSLNPQAYGLGAPQLQP